MAQLHLNVVSQEKALISTDVDQVSVPTVEGEITVLPGHIPLVTKLQAGELRYVEGSRTHSIVVSRGFFTVAPHDELTVIVDSAVHERDISMQQAEAAMKRAQETLKLTDDERERVKAEAELRLALLQMQIAERSRRSHI